MDWRRRRGQEGMQVVGYHVGDGGQLAPILATPGGSGQALPFSPGGGGGGAFMLAAPQVGPNAQNVPAWMAGRQAPGVWGNDEDLVPLQLIGETNGGIFTSSTPTTIAFTGSVQKPFRSERLVADVVPTGTSVAGVRAYAQAWVGTDYQGANIAPFSLSAYAATAFGVRLKLKPAEPGVIITIQVTLSVYPTSTDTVLVDLQILGAFYQ